MHIAILQHLETASRYVVFLAENVETAIHFASIDLAEGEYVNEVITNLKGQPWVVWNYIDQGEFELPSLYYEDMDG